MSTAKKFFEENIKFLPLVTISSPAELKREYNLNKGLLALASQLDQIQTDLHRVHQDVQRVEQIARGLR